MKKFMYVATPLILEVGLQVSGYQNPILGVILIGASGLAAAWIILTLAPVARRLASVVRRLEGFFEKAAGDGKRSNLRENPPVLSTAIVAPTHADRANIAKALPVEIELSKISAWEKQASFTFRLRIFNGSAFPVMITTGPRKLVTFNDRIITADVVGNMERPLRCGEWMHLDLRLAMAGDLWREVEGVRQRHEEYAFALNGLQVNAAINEPVEQSWQPLHLPDRIVIRSGEHVSPWLNNPEEQHKRYGR